MFSSVTARLVVHFVLIVHFLLLYDSCTVLKAAVM